ncbi:MAG TPA: Rieske (2Fe-2S) protein [Gemmatimonadaceae bacterium]|nr:Rieske (2Fe-2S) protein [Gemmatimonadaceae bacterium]
MSGNEHHVRDRAAPAAQESREGCGHCPLTVDRRTFLRGAALAAVGALAAGVAMPAVAQAVQTIRPLRRTGVERIYAIPGANGVSIDDANEVILVRWENKAYAFSTRCTHKGATLEWREDEGRVFCPKHKARFHPDGAHASGREARALDRYDITLRDGSLVVTLDALRRADADAEAWGAAFVQLG